MRDPLYSYIAYTKPAKRGEKTEEDIINDPWMQRLRRLRQNQWAYMVYPGLQHTRFEHSLGVMHLAGEFARTWYAAYRLASDAGKPSLRFPSVPFVEEIMRLAGLFHDIGHGPFSHSFERAAAKIFQFSFPSHEAISVAIVEKHFADLVTKIRRSPMGQFAKGENITREHVSYLINKKYLLSGSFPKLQIPLMDLLRPLISGIFDVDRMDYIARDAYHGGAIEYGTMDIERLRTTIYFGKDSNICIPRKSMPALRNLLLGRLQMHETCYYHPRVRAFEIEAEMNMTQTLKLENFPKNLKKKDFLNRFQELDDHWVYGKAVQWSTLGERTKKHKIGKAWIDLFSRKKRWKCVRSYERQISDKLRGLVKDDVPKVEQDLLALLQEWRKKGSTNKGKRWPSSVGKKEPLERCVRVDGPTYGAGITELFDRTGPYTIKSEQGADSARLTAQELLKQIAGVNFVALRIFASTGIADLVEEASDIVMQKHGHFLSGASS